MIPLDDEQMRSLVASANLGDRNAVNELLMHSRDFLASAAGDTSDHGCSPGTMQQALLRICCRLPSFKGETVTAFRSWIQSLSRDVSDDTPFENEAWSILSASDQEHWQRLIRTARGGCDQALVQVVNHFRSYLLMIANDQIGNSLQAKFGASDILQQSFLDVRRSLPQFRGSTELEMREWLKTIVLNNARDHARRFAKTRKRDVARETALTATELPSQQDTPSVVIRRRERDWELKRLVEQLPEAQKRVIEARHRDGLSYPKVAEHLGITETHARKLWSRATTQLRVWLREA